MVTLKGAAGVSPAGLSVTIGSFCRRDAGSLDFGRLESVRPPNRLPFVAAFVAKMYRFSRRERLSFVPDAGRSLKY